MSRTSFWVVIISVILSLAVNIFFGRWLTVKISTLPILNRWKILSPQSPIVINTKEEVRFSDAGDILQALNSAKSKLSAVAVRNAGSLGYAGNAVNLTSDGLFLTVKSVVGGGKPENIFIKLNDGGILKALSFVNDPATDLVIIKTAQNNIAAANFGSSKSLAPGEKVIFAAGSFLDSTPFFENNFVTTSQQNDFDQPKDANLPQRSFKVQSQDELINGTAIVNLNGEVVGLWDTGNIVSSDVVKDMLSNYFNNNNSLSRSVFGFKFRNVSAAEASILQLSPGAKVLFVSPGGGAQKAGLLPGDVITAVGNDSLTADASLEELLQKYHLGDNLPLTVMRGKDKLNLNLSVGALK